MLGDYRSIHNAIQESGRVHSEIRYLAGLVGGSENVETPGRGPENRSALRRPSSNDLPVER